MKVVGFKQSYYYPKTVVVEKPKTESEKVDCPKVETPKAEKQTTAKPTTGTVKQSTKAK